MKLITHKRRSAFFGHTFPRGIYAGKEGVRRHSESAEEKKSVNWEHYDQQSFSSSIIGKKFFFPRESKTGGTNHH